METTATPKVEAKVNDLTISWWEGRVRAKATVTTNAKLKFEATVKDNDLATDNPVVGEWGGGKGKGEDTSKAEGGGKGKGQ